jgi:nucleotide-binding universal stress UspA family protein
LRIIAARPIDVTVSPGIVVPPDLDAGIEQQLLDDAVDAVRRMPGGDAVDIKTDAFRAPAGVALVEASGSGDLLVVGTHGRGWLGRLALGSVSRHCVHHANVPTAVVPCFNRRDGTWIGLQVGRCAHHLS